MKRTEVNLMIKSNLAYSLPHTVIFLLKLFFNLKEQTRSKAP